VTYSDGVFLGLFLGVLLGLAADRILTWVDLKLAAPQKRRPHHAIRRVK